MVEVLYASPHGRGKKILTKSSEKVKMHGYRNQHIHISKQRVHVHIQMWKFFNWNCSKKDCVKADIRIEGKYDSPSEIYQRPYNADIPP